jgi:amidohydrolase
VSVAERRKVARQGASPVEAAAPRDPAAPAAPGDRDEIVAAVDRAAERAAGRTAEHFRRLHRHPELGWEEERTAAYVEAVLRGLGLTPRRLARTGVVADLAGTTDLPRRALRADLDALAAEEMTGLPYASERPGVMHACGHDAHAAVLLGAAEVLQDLAPLRRRAVRFLFQPAEELEPSGARALIAEGALEGIGDIVGFHVWPALTAGTIGLREGAVTAAADRWECELRGPGGHAARPHETVDLVALAARAIGLLVELPRRRLDPLRQPAVVTATRIHGGEAFNVIPSEVSFGGTIRTLDAESRSVLAREMEALARSLCEAAGARVDWRYELGSPPLVNDSAFVAFAREALGAVLGGGSVVPIEHPSLGSEDFSHYAAVVPGLYLRLGSTAPGAEAHPLHSTRFRVAEAALPVGVRALAGLALL